MSVHNLENQDHLYEVSYLDNDSKKLEHSKDIPITLYPHQLTWIQAALEMEKTHSVKCNFTDGINTIIKTKIGINSDPVGSGKTLEALGLILYSRLRKKFKPINQTYSSYYYYYDEKADDPEDSDEYKNTLIVVPHTLIFQWEKNIKLLNLNYNVVKNRKTLDNLELSDIMSSPILLISNTWLTHFCKKYIYHTWSRIIIDEPQLCNINGLLTIMEDYTNFIWFLCATPMYLLNTYKKSNKTIFKYDNFNNRRILYRLCLQNTYSYIKESIQLPPYYENIIQCLTPNVLKYFENDLPNKVIQLIGAGCSEKALEFLNCKSDTNENIIQALTKYYEKDLHNEQVQINCINQLLITDQEKDKRTKKRKIKVNQLKNKIKGIKDRISKENLDICPICINDLKIPMATPCCHNVFCLECIANSQKYKKECPLCRASINLNDIIALVDNKPEKEDKINKLPSKEEALIQILKNKNPDQKFLIFSKYGDTFKKIESQLVSEEIKYENINGTYKSIENKINRFKDGKTTILLLNSENFGAGLNLEMTTNLIIYHKLDSCLMKQVIGRAQRCGRTNTLSITYLKYDTEL